MKDMKTYSKVEIKKAIDNSAVSGKTLACLKRLAAYEPDLATHFAVVKPKNKDDVWSVRSVIRDEFVDDAAIVINIRKGTTAQEADVAITYVKEIIKKAQRAAQKKGGEKKEIVKDMNTAHWLSKDFPLWVKICTVPVAIFNFPVVVIGYLVKLYKKNS